MPSKQPDAYPPVRTWRDFRSIHSICDEATHPKIAIANLPEDEDKNLLQQGLNGLLAI